MSTFPLLMSLADELDNLTTRSYLDDFGLGFYPHRHYHRVPSLSLPSEAEWMENQQQQQQRRGSRTRKYFETPKEQQSSSHRNKYVGTEGFQVTMDVQKFNPNELTVKTVDNCVVVEGKHDEKADEHGYVSRQFTRRYELPNGYESDKVVSTLSSDGILTVKVALPASPSDDKSQRVVDIQQTGPAHLSINENKSAAEDEKEKENPEEDDSKESKK